MDELFISELLMDEIKKIKKNIPDNLMDQVEDIFLEEEKNAYYTIKTTEDLLFEYRTITLLNLFDDIEENKREQMSLAFFALAIRQLEYRMYNKAIENFYASLRISVDGDMEIIDKIAECFLKTGQGERIISDLLVENEEIIDGCTSEAVLFSATLYEILEGRNDTARYFFEKLRKLNYNVEKIFRYPNLPTAILTRKLRLVKRYTENSVIELIQVYSDFFQTPYYYEKLLYFSKNKLSDEEINKIGKRFRYNQHIILKEFSGLNDNIVEIFRNNAIYDKEDLESCTKEEILAIKGIGKKTIETLEKNGINFREK